ncbi:MAG: hypothetical protein H7039_17850 [Bryobacteraceae bacterium]|nr:hypothetical protein [Bryobacteraceae bacterium]
MNRHNHIEIEPPEFLPPLDNVTGVRTLIREFESSIGQKELKMSVTDYIRLVQLERELGEEEPQDVEVRWVDPTDETSDNAV